MSTHADSLVGDVAYERRESQVRPSAEHIQGSCGGVGKYNTQRLALRT
jgi:hypothetical protein